MPDGWYAGAVRDPGVLAGYARGRSAMALVVCHYTVGRDSTSIGRKGYFNFLVRRNGQIVQFAEADAVNWHACEWNSKGPGIEVEYLDESAIITPEAERALAGLCGWLADGWGISRVYHDEGARFAVGADVRGFVSHRKLHESACDEHYDFWPRDVAERILGGAPAPAPDDHEHDDQEDEMSETLASWTADNVPGEWHYAQVSVGGDAYHSWGPGDGGFEFLCGPTVPDTTRRTPKPITKVTRKLGAGSLTRLDLFFEMKDTDDVAHMWRNRNVDKWGFEIVHSG